MSFFADCHHNLLGFADIESRVMLVAPYYDALRQSPHMLYGSLVKTVSQAAESHIKDGRQRQLAARQPRKMPDKWHISDTKKGKMGTVRLTTRWEATSITRLPGGLRNNVLPSENTFFLFFNTCPEQSTCLYFKKQIGKLLIWACFPGLHLSDRREWQLIHVFK